MFEPLESRNLTALDPLPAPGEMKTRLPASEAAAATVWRTRAALRSQLHGEEPRRLVVIVGPCSIHDPDAALEYAARLATSAARLDDALLVVMRTYFEKPRTTLGWKGLINDPQIDGSCDLRHGLEIARKLLLDVNAMGLPCASELLDPLTPHYIADLLAWVAIGARTAGSQTHREMASGLSAPVGFKNGIDGGLQVALDGMLTAAQPHTLFGLNEQGSGAVLKTRGNADVHLVLRGGDGCPNHHAASVGEAARATQALGCPRGVLVDCSHGNSSKDPTRQAGVCREVISQLPSQPSLLGIMLESHLFPGRQDWQSADGRRYGVSITDACMGWNETHSLLEEAALAVRRGRENRPMHGETPEAPRAA